MAEDGISLMARDVKLDKIIGVAFSKIQVCYLQNNGKISEVKFIFPQRSKLIPTKNPLTLHTEPKILRVKMERRYCK